MEERDYSKLTIWQRRLMVAGFGAVCLLIMVVVAPSKARPGEFSWEEFRFGVLLGVVPGAAILAWLTSPSAQRRTAGLSQSRGAALGGAIGFPIMWALVYAPAGRAVVVIYGVVAGFCLGIALWGLFGRLPPLSPPGPPGSDAQNEAAPGDTPAGPE